jgi:hypothetical protein
MLKKKKDRDVGADRPVGSDSEGDEADNEFAKKRRMSWAALIKSVYEVDPLQYPNCGGKMKRISCIGFTHKTSLVKSKIIST